MTCKVRRSRGFTLVELIVTMAVLAIALAIAIPNLSGFVRQQRLVSLTNEFVSAINYCRNEAVTRGTRVTLCKSANGTSCTTSGGWEQGWMVFNDPNNSTTLDGTEQVLRVGPRAEGVSITGGGEGANYISYIGTGASAQKSGGFLATTITLTNGSYSKQIILNGFGRVRTQ